MSWPHPFLTSLTRASKTGCYHHTTSTSSCSSPASSGSSSSFNITYQTVVVLALVKDYPSPSSPFDCIRVVALQISLHEIGLLQKPRDLDKIELRLPRGTGLGSDRSRFQVDCLVVNRHCPSSRRTGPLATRFRQTPRFAIRGLDLSSL